VEEGGTTTMSIDSRDGLSMPARWKAIACAVAAFMAIGLSSVGSVQAQDASPMASPAAECDAPALPPGTPTPQEMASPEAMAGMDMASPEAEEATEEATAEEEDSGTPAEGADADEITATAENLIACINGGDYEGAVALMTENFMMSTFGTANPYDAVVMLEGFQLSDATVSDPYTYEDGSVSADITYMGSQYQLTGETWYFVQDGEYWKIDSQETFLPDYEGDSGTLGVDLVENEAEDGTKTYDFVIAGVANVDDPTLHATIAENDNIILHGNNKGTEAHEIVVFQLPEGADPMGVLDGSIPESDVTFIGQITIAPGQQGDMLLQGLPAGIYTTICFFPAADGAPHAAHGMIDQFEVTAPAS